MPQKLAIIKNMVWRSENLSAESYKPKNIDKILELLSKNGYPKKFSKKIIDDYLLRLKTKNCHPELSCNAKYFKFPYINGLTQMIRRILEDDDHKIATYNNNTSRILFSKLKDKIEMKDKTNVIYEIPCSDCDGVYIGQTKQNLEKRIKQTKTIRKLWMGSQIPTYLTLRRYLS